MVCLGTRTCRLGVGDAPTTWNRDSVRICHRERSLELCDPAHGRASDHIVVPAEACWFKNAQVSARLRTALSVSVGRALLAPCSHLASEQVPIAPVVPQRGFEP